MYSLETGVIVSIAAFFFFSFLTFTFLRERNITNEIAEKASVEKSHYEIDKKKDYYPEFINNIVDIVTEGDKINVGSDEE